MKWNWLVAIISLALVLAMVGLCGFSAGGAVTVMAQEKPTPTPEAGAKGCLARVAEILDIPQEDLVNAFKQAQQEMRQEAFIRALDEAVEQERITQEEANQIKEWWEQRPEVVDRPALCARISRSICSRHMLAIHRGWDGQRPPRPPVD